MQIKRTIKANIVSEYNDAAKCINDEELVVYVTGNAYEEIKTLAKKEKRGKNLAKGTGKIGCVVAGLCLFSGVATLPALGLIALGSGNILFANAGNSLKKYQVNDNKEKNRLELIRVKGRDAFNSQYDTIIE